jgi:periplasmic protein TonB
MEPISDAYGASTRGKRREPPFRPETFVVSEPHTDAPRNQSRTIQVSIFLHGLAIGALFLLPILSADSLPEPAHAVRAFFAEPAPLAPPPPPPPAAPKSLPRPQVIHPSEPTRFTSPVETPEGVRPDAGDLDVSSGGGVEGGVPGGVVGGVVGGLPEAPPPPQALRVGGQIKEPRKLKNVPPIYPELARASRVQGVVVLECLVSPAGRVVDVKVIRTIPLLDDAAVAAVKQWAYTPTLIDGVAVPVIMTVTVRFALS